MPTWETVAPNVYKILSRADLLIAHNGDEFVPFIDKELKRVGPKLPKISAIDTMRDGIWATSDGKKPNLCELAFACGIEYHPAKDYVASYNVDIMMRCFYKALDWGFFHFPEVEVD